MQMPGSDVTSFGSGEHVTTPTTEAHDDGDVSPRRDGDDQTTQGVSGCCGGRSYSVGRLTDEKGKNHTSHQLLSVFDAARKE